MLATDDYPTRAAAHPPRKRGGLGRGFFNVLVAFGELVLLTQWQFLACPLKCLLPTANFLINYS
jgi:hypothetical protein